MATTADVLCCNCLCFKDAIYAAGSNADCCLTYYYKISCLIVFIICLILSAIYYDQSPDEANALLLLCLICSIFGCCLICYFPIMISRQLIFGWQSMPLSHVQPTSNGNNQLSNHFNYVATMEMLLLFQWDTGN